MRRSSSSARWPVTATQIDNRARLPLITGVNYTEAKRHYLEVLGRDRTTPAPRLRLATVDDLHAWKQEMRAYDVAQIELKIVTPREVQERNAATTVQRGRARIVRRAAYA